MIDKCVVRLLGTPKGWMVQIPEAGCRGQLLTSLTWRQRGWVERPLNSSVREVASWFVPNPVEIQRARKCIDTDHVGQPPRAQKRMKKKMEEETETANEDIHCRPFSAVGTCENIMVSKFDLKL